MLQRNIISALFFFILMSSVAGQAPGKEFIIYLVRHAEKETDGTRPNDPDLTEAGKSRAEKLASFFNDVHLNRIYSTDYIRTLETAKPTAVSKGLEPELYSVLNLDEFSKLLLSRREDALVVGHSNTTPWLAGMIAGEEMEPIDETVYDRIYKVVIRRRSATVTILNQGSGPDQGSDHNTAPKKMFDRGILSGNEY